MNSLSAYFFGQEIEINSHRFITKLFTQDFQWARDFLYPFIERATTNLIRKVKKRNTFENLLTLDLLKQFLEDLGIQIQNHLVMLLLSMGKWSDLIQQNLFELVLRNRIQDQDIFAVLSRIFPIEDPNFDLQLVKQALIDILLCVFPATESNTPSLIVSLENHKTLFHKDAVYLQIEQLFLDRKNAFLNSDSGYLVSIGEVQRVMARGQLFLTERQIWILFLYAGLYEFQRNRQNYILEEIESFLNQTKSEFVLEPPQFKISFYSLLVLFETPVSLRLPLQVKEILLELRASHVSFSIDNPYAFNARNSEKAKAKLKLTLPVTTISLEEKRYSTKDTLFVEVRFFRIRFPGLIKYLEKTEYQSNPRPFVTSKIIYKKLVFRIIRGNFIESIGTPLIMCK